MAKPKRETVRHVQAFEYYYALGNERSTAKVALKFGVSETAVNGWSSAFGWSNRVAARDREAGKKLTEKLKTQHQEMLERQLGIARAIQISVARRLTGDASKGIKPDLKPDAKDFASAANLEREILGIGGPQSSQQDIQEMFRMILQILHTRLPDSCPYCKQLLNLKNVLADDFDRMAEKFALVARMRADDTAKAKLSHDQEPPATSPEGPGGTATA